MPSTSGPHFRSGTTWPGSLPTTIEWPRGPAERPHARGRLGRILLVTVVAVTVGSIVLLVTPRLKLDVARPG